ncbi:MAG: helix-turn-helix transcriptional regulator [Acidobacteriia bacterium]|nr:helix-turn-helix transcriptional regulator [Terriglobia bacterium]
MSRLVKNAAAGGGELLPSKVPRVEEGAAEERASARLGSYLRRLRGGYGYTLRRVEEAAMALGEVIDNSQLSRFEKGKAIPSFDKLRALARIFNVSVQTFSDVLDLEEYEAFEPESGGFDELIREGAGLFAAGEHGKAFVTFERALNVALEENDTPERAEREAQARWSMITSLRALGKLAMTERELREILKSRSRLSPVTRTRSVLELSYVYREQGDLYLAGVLAHEALELALGAGDVKTQAGVLNTLGNIHHDEGEAERALGYYLRSMEVLDALGGQDKLRTTVTTNLGGCLVELGRFDEGIARLRQAHAKARELGFRRVAALSLTRLSEAFMRRGERDRALQALSESDALASRPDEAYQDILFLNSYHRWQMARQDANPTREKIAFGRLRHLRSLLERRFPEVDEFDRHIERIGRVHAYSP